MAGVEALGLHHLGEMSALQTDLAVENVGNVALERTVGFERLAVL